MLDAQRWARIRLTSLTGDSSPTVAQQGRMGGWGVGGVQTVSPGSRTFSGEGEQQASVATEKRNCAEGEPEVPSVP